MATYTGTDNDDTLAGSAGADTLSGGLGNDSYLVNHRGDVVIEEHGMGVDSIDGGNDTILTSVLVAGGYSLLGSWTIENLSYTGTLAATLRGNDLANIIHASSTAATDDLLQGNAGDDSLYGHAGNDRLEGGRGNDLLDGGTGDDTMVGGFGDDTYLVDSAGDRVFEIANAGIDTVRSDGIVLDLRAGSRVNLENVVHTGNTAVTMHGNAAANLVQSLGAGADRLYGEAGNDTLDGGAGNDTLIGGTGDDVYFVGTGDAVVERANEGIDTLIGNRTSLATTTTTYIENLFYTGAAGATLTGNALDNFIAGGAGKDTINGGDGNDALLGGAGADSLSGGAGADTLYGGGSQLDGRWASNGIGAFHFAGVDDGVADTLAGGAGNDTYLIDNADDRIIETASGGIDTVITSVDYSLAGAANVENIICADHSWDDRGAWHVEGSAGDNIIVGNSYENLLVGGAGNDTLMASRLTSGTSVGGGYYTDLVDQLVGGDGNDVLIAERLAVVEGGAGDDIYFLGGDYYAANTSFAGYDESGNDTVVFMYSGSGEALEGVENFALAGSGIAAEATALAAVYAASSAAGAPLAAWWHWSGSDLSGNALDNVITGNAGNNRLAGLDGDDSILGGAGDDTLDGGAGADTLVGGAGSDVYIVDADDTVIETGTGASDRDLVQSDVLTSYAGFSGIEGLRYTGASGALLRNAINNAGNDWFEGGAGNDTLIGYGGNDSLMGGVGNDSLRGDAGNDTLDGGTGTDTIDGGDGNDSIGGELFGASVLGGAGDDYIRGSDDATVVGRAGARLDGGTGNDTIYGTGGDDTIIGGSGIDRLYGGNGNDSIVGNAADDYLGGDAGNDTIVGGGLATNIFGGDGDDLIDLSGVNLASGIGLYYVANTLEVRGDGWTPGGGADVFRLGTAVGGQLVNSGATPVFCDGVEIKDFESGIDRIEIAGSAVGDGDTLLEHVQVVSAANATFSAASEMVIVTADTVDFSWGTGNYAYWGSAIRADNLDFTIGNADAALAVGQERLFVVDDGNSSAVFRFVSANGDAVVSMNELRLLAVVDGDSSLTAADFALFA